MQNISVAQVFNLIRLVVGYALLLLVAAAVAQAFGAHLPYIPAVDPIRLCYICGAWWLACK